MTLVDTGVQSVNLQHLEMKEWNRVSKKFHPQYSAKLYTGNSTTICYCDNYTFLFGKQRNLFCIHNANEYYSYSSTVHILGCGGSGSCSILVTGEAPEAVEEDNSIIQ